MINVCPQCKAPIPREVSRFCNQCGADLRPISAPLTPIDVNQPAPSLEAHETAPETPERVAAPDSASLRQSTQRKIMVVPKDDANLLRPEATLRIILRD